MKLIDSHAHLDDRAFSKDRAALIAGLHAKRIGAITIGSSLRSSESAVALATKYRGIWATVGVHPHNAKDVEDETLVALRNMGEHASVVGIGEIGLDYYRDLSPRSKQRAAFRDQLRLARSLDLPVVLQNRESTEDLLGILRDEASVHRGVVHSFLGDAELAEAFLDLGLHLGIGGPLTYKKNDVLRSAVRGAPLERLLVETDCPYLTPVPYRGRRNEPAYIQYVVEMIADLKGITVDDVAHQTTENTIQLFDLSLPETSRSA